MENIKFRAWGRTKKEFAYMVIGHHSRNPLVIPTNYFEDIDEWKQYIGLRDKHNREIYEGSIVTFKDGAPYEVKYDEKWLGFQPWRSFIEDDAMWKSCNIEVIGNIYENKELLKWN